MVRVEVLVVEIVVNKQSRIFIFDTQEEAREALQFDKRIRMLIHKSKQKPGIWDMMATDKAST